MTGAQAANPSTEGPNEVHSQWIQHHTLETCAFITPGNTPDIYLIFAASFVTGDTMMGSLLSFALLFLLIELCLCVYKNEVTT